MKGFLLHHAFLEQAAAQPEKIAVVCGERRASYGELRDRSDRLARTLAEHGVRKGDRVLLFADHSVSQVIGIMATLQVGGVFSPINPLTKAEKLAYLFNDAEPVCVIASASLAHILLPALSRNRSVRVCIVSEGPVPPSHLPLRFLSFTEALETSEPGFFDPGTIDQDLAAIIYTSGSTGEPKGVTLTHLNMITAARSVGAYLGLRAEDIILCPLPLAFDYGLYQILMGLGVGATVILGHAFAFPMEILKTMERERVTVLPGVPTLFSTLLGMETLAHYDLSRLRLITNTAAALSEGQIRDLQNSFPQATLFSMYGLTECKRVSFLPPEELARRPTSVGKGMPNEEVFLVDAEDRRLPNGSTGELVIRGSHVMRGYWRKPKETAERLKIDPNTGERLLYSGDIFRTDADGYLYFVGRQDDIIKSRGEKVSPREVENVLHGIAGVQEAAVIGVPDEVLGSAIKAFLVLRPGFTYSERDVIRHCLSHLENHMVPKYVDFVPDLPKTDTGKIKKAALTG